MTPDFDIRLASMVKALSEIVLPAVDAGDSLALEQLNITIGHLDMLRQQLPFSQDYSERCLADMSRLAADLQTCAPAARRLVEPALAATRSENASPLEARDRLAGALCDAIAQVAETGAEEDWRKIAGLVLRHETAAHYRDRAWFARTGMDPEVAELPSIADLLSASDGSDEEQTARGSRHPLIESLSRGWAGDLDALLSVYTEDCLFEDKAFGLTHHGHAGIKEVFDFSFSMMPDFRVDYRRHTVIADTAAAEWTFSGSFHGEFEGRKHEGTPVQVDGVSFMTLRDGKILTNCDYHNLGALSAQLGGG